MASSVSRVYPDIRNVQRDFIGINIEGWVLNEGFERAREKAKLIKSEMAEAADTEEERREFLEHWPFQDHEEID